jgi:uncharacterized protein
MQKALIRRGFSQVHTHYRPLRLNVGFLLSQSAGYGRQFDFQEPKLTLGGDLQVEEFTGRVQLNRTPQGIVAQGDFTAQLPAECARCLKPFAAPLTIHLEDLFVYPPQNATDPLLSVGEDAHLNLEPLLREYILINQPTRLLCRPDCKGLCTVCGNDLNESACSHPEVEERRLLPDRMVVPSANVKEKTTAPAQPKKPETAKAPSNPRKRTVRTKKPAKKAAAAAKPRKPTSGGRKSAAGKKSSGANKKTITKK